MQKKSKVNRLSFYLFFSIKYPPYNLLANVNFFEEFSMAFSQNCSWISAITRRISVLTPRNGPFRKSQTKNPMVWNRTILVANSLLPGNSDCNNCTVSAASVWQVETKCHPHHHQPKIHIIVTRDEWMGCSWIARGFSFNWRWFSSKTHQYPTDESL